MPVLEPPSLSALASNDPYVEMPVLEEPFLEMLPEWPGAHHAERDGCFDPPSAALLTLPPELSPVVAEPIADSFDPASAVEPVPPTLHTQNPRASAQAASSAIYPAIDWHQTLWIVWLTGTFLTAALALWRIVRFRKLLQAATPADPQIIAIARELAADLGLRNLPDIRITSGRVPPLLFAGLFRTTVLLPRDLLTSLDDESHRTLLAHELAHLARRDHWTRWLELIVRSLYWWHPVAWWAGRKLREAEEQCCDARVVRLLPGSAAAYAHTILTTVDYLTTGTRPIPRPWPPASNRFAAPSAPCTGD